jgi:hypothetical protein
MEGLTMKNKKIIMVIGVLAMSLIIFLSVNQSKHDKLTSVDDASARVSVEMDTELENIQEDESDTQDAFSKKNEVGVASILGDVNPEASLSSNNQEDINTEVEELVIKYYDMTVDLNSQILYAESAKKIEKWSEELTKKREIIESYKNITIYNKPGLTENTYVVFATYDMKLNNIETLVPGMSVLLVIRNESGELLIENKSVDEKLNDYISKLAQEADIKNIIDDVNKRLKKAIKKDSSLEVFIEYLKETS